MMYEHRCDDCDKAFIFQRTVDECSKAEKCPVCNKKTVRLYSMYKSPEFPTYFDETYGCEIRNATQEKKIMKKHGHILARDVPKSSQFKESLDRARVQKNGAKVYNIGGKR